jgi:hypothetical protein
MAAGAAPARQLPRDRVTLPEFIEREIDHLVSEWVRFAAAELPSARRLSPDALRDGARALLLDIADDMDTPQSGGESRDKSRGLRPRNSPEVTRRAHEHARHRYDSGFALTELVSEFRALRASVVRRWTERRIGPCGPEVLAELVRFDEAMDQALAESTAWYAARVEEARDLLLGVLGHDLRTPLGAVRTSATYLARTEGLSAAQSRAVGRVQSSTLRMQRMIDDLLDYTRTRLGRGLPIEPRPGDMAEIGRSVVDELRALHPDRTLRLDCTGRLTGRWDAARLKQLLSNLVSNAIQHGEPDAPVNVGVRGGSDAVVLRVHNLGPPIAPDAVGVLFEPLMRAMVQEVERREGSSGLGLGLYIAHRIAVAHGGSIEVASSAAAGTTFTVRLPRRTRVADSSGAGPS